MHTFATISLQIRCTGTAYGDIRTKSAAQVPHLLTFASMSLQIRCTGTAYAPFRTKSAAQAPHMLTFASISLQIRCTGTAYAHFRCNFVVNPPSLRTETPSAAVWAKPSWISLGSPQFSPPTGTLLPDWPAAAPKPPTHFLKGGPRQLTKRERIGQFGR